MVATTKAFRLSQTKGVEFLFRARKILAAVLTIAAGIFIAYTATTSQENIELIASILVLTMLLLVTANRPFAGLLAWIFFMPFIETWIEIPLGRGVPDLSYSRFAIIFIVSVMLFRAVSGRFSFRPLSATDFCIVLIPLGFIVSAPLSGHPIGVVQTAISLHFVPVAGYFITKNLVRDRGDLHALLLVIAIFGTIAGAHAIFEALTGNILFWAKGQEVTRVYRGDSSLRLILGLIGSTGAMGRTLATTILISLYLILEEKSGLKKLLLIAGITLQMGGVAVTFSRTPIVAVFIGFCIFQFFYPQFRKVLIVLIVLGAMFFALSWDRIQKTDVAQDRITAGSQDYAGRTTRWATGLNMWIAKPIRGWGVDSFPEISGRFRTDGIRRNLDAVESEYIFLLSSTGLIGFSPYLLFLFKPFQNSLRLYARSRKPDWQGFITPNTFALYWAVMSAFMLVMFSARNTRPIVKLLPFVVVGAIVGSQEYLAAKNSQ